MRNLGKLWRDCHSGEILEGRWEYQRKIVIGNVTFEDKDLIDVNFSRGLMAKTISLGNTISASLSAILVPYTDQVVYRNSKVEYYVRVIDLDNNVSPWAKFGEFYVDKVEKEFDKYRIECFDAMYLSEDKFPRGNYTAKQAVTMIASEMGVNIVNLGSFSDFSMKIEQDFTHREILGYVASMNVGNFFINEEGNLKFNKLTISTPVQDILPSNTKKIVGSESIKFDKVTVKYGSSNEEKFVAGTGNIEFEIFNPFADSQMANRLLNFFEGYTFYPGDMSSTGIDPAIELGDTINVDGLNINLINVSYSTRMYANVDIPYETNRLQDVFHFEAAEGKDYDDEIEDHEDRISILEDLMNLGSCLMVKKDMLVYINEDRDSALITADYSNKCFTIPREIKTIQISEAVGKPVRLVGGSGITTANRLIYTTPVPDMRDFMISEQTMDFERAFWLSQYVDSSMWGNMGNNANLMFTKSAWFKDREFGDFTMFSNIISMYEIFQGFELYTTRDYSLKVDISKADSLPLDSVFSIANYSSIYKDRTKINADLTGVIGLDTVNQSFSSAISNVYLNSIKLPNDAFKRASGVPYLFRDATIDNIDFSKLNFSSAQDVYGLFYNSDLNRGNYDLSSISFYSGSYMDSLESMFEKSRAKEVKFNENVTLSNIKTIRKMFSGCDILVNVDMPTIEMSGLLPSETEPYIYNAENILSGCKNLKTQIFDNIHCDEAGWPRGNVVKLGNIDDLDLGGTLRLTNFTGVYMTSVGDYPEDPDIFSRSKVREVIVRRGSSQTYIDKMNSYFNNVTFVAE